MKIAIQIFIWLAAITAAAQTSLITGTVSRVGATSATPALIITGSPITSSGDLGFNLASNLADWANIQTNSLLFYAPTSSIFVTASITNSLAGTNLIYRILPGTNMVAVTNDFDVILSSTASGGGDFTTNFNNITVTNAIHSPGLYTLDWNGTPLVSIHFNTVQVVRCIRRASGYASLEASITDADIAAYVAGPIISAGESWKKLMLDEDNRIKLEAPQNHGDDLAAAHAEATQIIAALNNTEP